MQRLKDHDLKINPDKCTWFATQIKLLGHIVNKFGIKMDPEKVEAIKERREPTNVKQVQQFLGMTNYYRKFIEKYALIAAPLHKLTSNSTIWSWNNDCQQAFETLKEKLSTYPILRSPDFEKPFILHTDASHIALGAILAQKDNQNREYACHYASKLLKPNERTYGITELECLAIIWSINHFRTYLYGNKFTIFSDNQALKWLQGLKSPSARLTRWAILLSQFDFDIKHRSGKTHTNEDALSRPVLLTTEIQSNDLIEESLKLADPYEDEPLLFYLKFRKHAPGTSKKQVKRVERSAELYKLLDNGEIIARKNPTLEFNLTVPKPEERESIILKEHEINHAKSSKIHSSLSAKNIFWKNMNKTIDSVINKCTICLKYDKYKQISDTAIAISIDNIFDKIGIDLVNGIPTSSEGHCSLLVIVEYLSKFTWGFPLKTKSAEEITKHLTNFVCTYGPPKCIISDQGKEFINSTVQELCNRLEIIKRTTSPYNPRANGQTERTNQTITRLLIKHCDENPESWPETLNITLLAYNTSIHSSTNKTPFELLFGRKFGKFDNWIDLEKEKEKLAIENRELQLKQLYDETHEQAINNIAEAQTKQIKSRSNASHDQLLKGDRVFIKNCKLVKSKFEPEYNGPFVIKDRNTSSGNYILETENKITLSETYPRWKLKPIENHTDTKIEKQTSQIDKSKYRILHYQKIGRGFRCEIEYQDKSTEWVSGKQIDPKMLDEFHKRNNTRFYATKPSFFTFAIFIPLLLHIATAQVIEGPMKYCTTKENNRIINPNIECRRNEANPATLLKFDGIYFPTTAHIISKNKYYGTDTGYQCYKKKIQHTNERSWIILAKRVTTEHIVEMTRLECFTMVESKRCNNNKMTCNEEGCFYKPPTIDEDLFFRDTISDTYECAFHKKRIIGETPESKIFNTEAEGCRYIDLQCKLYNSIVVWKNNSNVNSCQLTKIHKGKNYKIFKK